MNKQISLLVLVILIYSSQVCLGTENFEKKTIVSGIPKDKQQQFIQGMAKNKKKVYYYEEANKQFHRNKYESALRFIEEGLLYAEAEKLNPFTLRWKRMEIYEAMRDQRFLDDIDWLMNKTQDDKVRSKLNFRRDKFIEAHVSHSS